MKLTSALKRVGSTTALALSLGIALPAASNAEPGRYYEIEIDASTYWITNPSTLEGDGLFGSQFNYSIDGVQQGDSVTLRLKNLQPLMGTNIVNFLQNAPGYEINYNYEDEMITPEGENWMGPEYNYYIFWDEYQVIDLDVNITIGENLTLDDVFGALYFATLINENLGFYSVLLSSTGQWLGSSGAQPLTYGNPNSYTDPTGELRSLINQIKGLSGNLIGWK